MPEPHSLPEVLSANVHEQRFPGDLIEVCFATEDLQRTMEGMLRLGIGPWRVYTFDGSTVTDREYGGEPADWGLKVAFADVGDIAFELMQPLYGPSIIREFLDTSGEGVHHIAFDCGETAWDSRAEEFGRRGFPCSRAGRFMDSNAFAFFDTAGATTTTTTTTFETYTIPQGFVWPEPEMWFPAPPPVGEAPPVREQRN
ncbi:VOC family protein [Nocardioides sp. B-3]|uniref:VOC family protein n=1 Tax=Nocardioides sp. B-3 TaxID=2895565 RepID=UPI0021539A54|nr:VOC family protein [Nocardioides sp. B-3]UUZ59928.1 VOC family protein [Nocardioides sp. B-3]